MRILAIDPGTTHSGLVFLEDGRVTDSASAADNDAILATIAHLGAEHVAIEQIRSFGPDVWVGNETHETTHWAGRFHQRALDSGCNVLLIPRTEIKLHLTGSVRTKDPHVAGALRDLYGGAKACKGTKAAPGPLYGVSGHAWAALALAKTAEARLLLEARRVA